MTTDLAIQLLITFVIGGSVITFLTLLAERVNERISGIIMMFPSTIVLGFFFLGKATSADQVAMVVPATLIPLGIVIFSSVLYIRFASFLAKHIKNRTSQIILTLIATSIAWFSFAAPFAIWKFTHLWIGIAGFLALITLSHYLLNGKQTSESIERPKYTNMQIFIRAMFTGTVIAVVVFLGKMLGPFWGGVFTMYPAATLASLMIFHFYYRPNQLSYFMKKVPMGSISLLLYTIAVMLLFPIYGITIGTLFAYLISLVYSLGLIFYRLKKV
jgi:hypothetical protein